MYNNKEYWSKRELSDTPNNPIVEKYIKDHLQGDTVLDFGVGNGKKLHLYKGYSVTGCDISDKYKDVCIERAEKLGLDYTHNDKRVMLNIFDNIVCSKVLLHIGPNEIDEVISNLRSIGERIIVWDIDRPDGAEHVFNHDFSNYFDMKDVQKINGQILFYATLDH